jgi:hypothetical protein
MRQSEYERRGQQELACQHCGGRFEAVRYQEFCSDYCRQMASGIPKQPDRVQHEWKLPLRTIGSVPLFRDGEGSVFIQVPALDEKDEQ